jgi:hypothetical protein
MWLGADHFHNMRFVPAAPASVHALRDLVSTALGLGGRLVTRRA